VRNRVGAIAWFITGAAIGFGSLALAFASLGAIVLLPALAIGAVLLVFRIRPASMLLVGAGLGVAVPWILHIASGNTPDSELWPVFVGLALLATGLFMFFTQKSEPNPVQAKPRARSV
jgi:hypothetical protein